MTSAVFEAFMFRALRFNPSVAMHELRSRMRGWRPFATMLGYSILAATAVIITLTIYTVGEHYSGGPGYQTTPLGLIAFSVLTFTQMALLVILLPVQAAAAITMEREKRTIEMLRATLLTPRDIVTGKLVVLMAFTVVLLMATVPIAMWCMLLGGLEPRLVFFSYTYLLATGLWISTLGLVFSAWRPRSLSATASAYFAIAVLLAGAPAIYMAVIAAVESASPGAVNTLGTDGALVFVALAGVLAAWISLSLFRAAEGFLARRGVASGLRTLLAGLLGLALLGAALLWLTNHLLPVLAAATPWAPMVLHPVVGLAGILFEELGHEIVFGTSSSTTPTAPDLQLIVWAQSGLALLVGGFLMWLLSMQAFEAYKEREG